MRYATIVFTGVCLSWALTQAQPQTAAPAAQGQNAPAANTAEGQGPSEVVQAAAQGMLQDLDKDGELVDKYLLPHFDTETAARLVLGVHWRTATPEQRKHFIDAFYHSLLVNYGSALVDYTADKLKIYP